MLTSRRSGTLLSVLLTFSVAVCLPGWAQVNGVPPSVTSIGFGGRFLNGVRPSVTSLGSNLGSNGYSISGPVFGHCCANFVWPANPNLPLTSGHHHRKDHTAYAVGVLEPVYIPYEVPYAPEAADGSPEANLGQSPVPLAPATSDGEGDGAPQSPQVEAKEDEPVDVQPATVLVFKDGHQSDVLNYAIVGDTLFDFEAGRTRKILLADLDLKATRKVNDDLGVEFEIPAGPSGQ
jgi:hypothetical protein